MRVVDRAAVFAQIKGCTESVWAQRQTLEPDAPVIPITGDLQLSQFDSFSVIELVVDLEEALSIDILEDLVEFSGQTFDDFVDFIIERTHLGQDVQLHDAP